MNDIHRSREGYTVIIANNPMKSDVERNFLDNAIRGLLPLCKELYVIAGNFDRGYGERVHLIDIHEDEATRRASTLLRRIMKNLSAQSQMIFNLILVSSRSGIVFYDVGEYRNLIAILMGKLLGKTTLVYHHGGNKFLEGRILYRNGAQRIIPYVQECMLRLCYRLVDHVLCQSPTIVEFGGLQAYRKKIFFLKHFVDIDRFVPGTPPTGKKNLIGYFGNLAPKKGILNVVDSMPMILKQDKNMQLVLAGTGEMKSALLELVKHKGLDESVKFLPWIPDESYPVRLRELKFFILPSAEEGVPATVLEAMASGVIPIVTPVGGIPDIVNDGETGFVIPDARPSSIATGVIRALRNSNLDQISKKGAEFVRNEYSLQAVAENYGEILASIQKAQIAE